MAKIKFFSELFTGHEKAKKPFLQQKFLHLLKFHFFPFQSVIKRLTLFDEEISKLGIAKSSQRLLDSFNIEVKIINPPRINPNCGYIIYGNHPSYAEPLALFSLLGDKKTKMIAGDNVAKIGPNFSRYLFPVQNIQFRNGRFGNLSNYLLFLFAKDYFNFHQRKRATAHNLKLTKKIPDFIASGKKFIIFPNGQQANPMHCWRNGIGFILSDALKKKNCLSIKLLPFYVKIGSPILFQLRFLYSLKNKMEIVFGKETGGEKFAQTAPKTIVRKMEQDYTKWLKTTLS